MGLDSLFDLAACADCLMWTANGELPPDNTEEQDEALLGGIEELWPIENWHIACDGEELGFSWSGCECCGSRLGGDRYKLVAWRKK